MDEEGCYWSRDPWRRRSAPLRSRGRLAGTVDLPVSQPTMCAFVGEALDEMVVTSATDKLTPEQRMREPLAGALLRLQPGVRGIPRPCVVR